MGLLLEFIEVFGETVRDVLPIIAILFIFQVFIIRKPVTNLKNIIIGFVYVLIGLALFLLGLEKALFPLGKLMATQLSNPEFIAEKVNGVAMAVDWTKYYWVYLFAFSIGFATTIAEPSLIAVAMKAQELSGGAIKSWGLRIAVAIGVAFGIALGSYRIVSGTPLHYYIIVGYSLVIILTWFAPRTIVPLAYDSGGVTTSTVTVPLVAALGLGLADSIPGRSTLLDGFGLIAFAGPSAILAVMTYALLSEYRAHRARKRSE